MENLKNWKKEINEYGALHNTNCCVNYENKGSCDFYVENDDCCENIRTVASIIQQHSRNLIEFLSHDMNFENEKQRKTAIEMYVDSLDF